MTPKPLHLCGPAWHMTTRVNFLYIEAPGRKNKSPPPNRIFEIWIMMCKAFIPNANYNSIGPGSLHPIVLTQKEHRVYWIKAWCREVHWKCRKKSTMSDTFFTSHCETLYNCNLLTARTVSLQGHSWRQTHCTSVVPACTWPPKSSSFTLKHLGGRGKFSTPNRSCQIWI